MAAHRIHFLNFIKKYLMLSIPTIILALLFIIILSVKRKSSKVEIIDAKADQISFLFVGNSQNIDLHKLLRAGLTMESLKLTNFGPMKLWTDKLMKETKIGLQSYFISDSITIVPSKRSKSARITFYSTSYNGLNLNELMVPPYARISLYRNKEIISIGIALEIENSYIEARGVFSTIGNFRFMIEKSLILDSKGNIIEDVRRHGQSIFLVKPSRKARNIVFNGQDGKLNIEITLKDTSTLRGIFKRIEARDISFLQLVREDNEAYEENTLKSAKIVLTDISDIPLNMVAGKSFFAKPDSFLIDSIDLEAEELLLNAHSLIPVKSMKIGISEDEAKQKLPSVLEWLFGDNTIAIGVCIILWFLAKVFTIRQVYINDIKESITK